MDPLLRKKCKTALRDVESDSQHLSIRRYRSLSITIEQSFVNEIWIRDYYFHAYFVTHTCVRHNAEYLHLFGHRPLPYSHRSVELQPGDKSTPAVHWYFDYAIRETAAGPNWSVNFKMSPRPFVITINTRLSFFFSHLYPSSFFSSRDPDRIDLARSTAGPLA